MASDTIQEIIPNKGFIHKLPVEVMQRTPVCMIITSPLPAKPLDKVVFIIKSHDQGWCSQDNFDGVYPGSLTWFEAMILRPVGWDDDWISLYWAKRDIYSEPAVVRALAELAGLEKLPPKEQPILRFVPNLERPPSHSWHLQKNRRGKGDPKEHTIVWDKLGRKLGTERAGWEFDANTGASSGTGFVSSLQEGDRIVIIACAEGSDAVNHVLEMQIKIEFEEEATTKTTATQSTVPEKPPTDTPAAQDQVRSFWRNFRW